MIPIAQLVKIRPGKALKILAVVLVLTIAFTAARIYTYGRTTADIDADAAVVLGAAVWSNSVSPVFRERINHAIDLYRRGKVRKIIFTGGQGNANEPTEASAARSHAVANGIPLQAILIEQKSHTTYENIVYAKQIADANNLKKVLLVSDPMHMRRAMTMARDIGLDASPSPTPTTLYQGWQTQLRELSRETFYYLGYLIAG
ncbi:MAG: protein sanA-like protein [Acidobacteria bacterium]|nr:MAG: protein sanA-like protein [Acidobacteriota bacterium]